jgi:hypothetical protein
MLSALRGATRTGHHLGEHTMHRSTGLGRSAVTLVTTLLLVQCTDGARSPVAPGGALASAKSGGSTTVTVKAASPSFGDQGQVNETVAITGSGFQAGAQAQWLLASGAVDTTITVVSTQVVSSTQLTSVISISPRSPVASRGIQVTNADRTKGIGSSIFDVIGIIAYSSRGGNTSTDTLWVSNANGSDAVAVADSMFAPSWAPGGDGSAGNPYHLVFQRGNCGMGRLDVTNVNGTFQGGSSTTLPMPVQNCYLEAPAWSPASDTIAFTTWGPAFSAPSSLWLTPSAGGPSVAIYTAPTGNEVLWAAWRGDASEIAFVERDSTATNWWVKVLTRGTGTVTTVLGPTTVKSVRWLDWARTKDVLAFDGLLTNGTQGVFTLDLTSGGPPILVLAGAGMPTWSPDDTQMALIGPATRRGSPSLEIVSVATGSVIVSLTSDGTTPDWHR